MEVVSEGKEVWLGPGGAGALTLLVVHVVTKVIIIVLTFLVKEVLVRKLPRVS